MSGGFFDYKQFHIQYITDELEETIENQKSRLENNDPGHYSKEMIEEMERVLKRLKEDYVLIHHLDYLLDGDIDENDYFERIKKDLPNQ